MLAQSSSTQKLKMDCTNSWLKTPHPQCRIIFLDTIMNIKLLFHFSLETNYWKYVFMSNQAFQYSNNLTWGTWGPHVERTSGTSWASPFKCWKVRFNIIKRLVSMKNLTLTENIHCVSNDMPDRAHRRQLSQFRFNFISKILAWGRNNLSDIMPWILFSSVSSEDWREQKKQFGLTKETFHLR